MTSPVDLSNLREMTSADAALEQALFSEFCKSGAECIETLEMSLDEKSSALWKSSAHALKGTAFGLGANELGALCKEAQEVTDSGEDVKREVLTKIKQEFELTQNFLMTLKPT
jgi:HPt (histidine-containing phosphotransfer) domain-containing protein